MTPARSAGAALIAAWLSLSGGRAPAQGGAAHTDRRRGQRRERARLAARVPRNRDAVLRRVVALQMRAGLRAGRPIHPRTLELWNARAASRTEDRRAPDRLPA